MNSHHNYKMLIFMLFVIYLKMLEDARIIETMVRRNNSTITNLYYRFTVTMPRLSEMWIIGNCYSRLNIDLIMDTWLVLNVPWIAFSILEKCTTTEFNAVTFAFSSILTVSVADLKSTNWLYAIEFGMFSLFSVPLLTLICQIRTRMTHIRDEFLTVIPVIWIIE